MSIIILNIEFGFYHQKLHAKAKISIHACDVKCDGLKLNALAGLINSMRFSTCNSTGYRI
jgi:hypothetical protein